MKYPYYEVCIGPGPFLPGDDSNFWMCIHGVRQPTKAEAEQFLAEGRQNPRRQSAGGPSDQRGGSKRVL